MHSSGKGCEYPRGQKLTYVLSVSEVAAWKHALLWILYKGKEDDTSLETLDECPCLHKRPSFLFSSRPGSFEVEVVSAALGFTSSLAIFFPFFFFFSFFYSSRCSKARQLYLFERQTERLTNGQDKSVCLASKRMTILGSSRNVFIYLNQKLNFDKYTLAKEMECCNFEVSSRAKITVKELKFLLKSQSLQTKHIKSTFIADDSSKERQCLFSPFLLCSKY